MKRAAVLLALLPHAAAWVNYYASELDPVSLIYRWDSPSEFSSDAGLGSGLTWAAQDDFCSKLLPRFYAERQFNLVECEDLMDSIVRGFSTWSTNHRRVTFYDLTSECKDYSPAYVPASGEDPPASFDDECPRLEISITAGGPLDHDHGHDHMAAVVYNMPADRRTWKTHTRSTAGYVYANSRAIELSRMHFNTENCWYLDNSFCSGFHTTGESIDVGALCAIFTFVPFAFALLFTLAYLFRMVLMIKNHGSEGFWQHIEDSAKWYMPIILLMLTAPMLFYFYIYTPCVECYDFEAAVAHEIGHVMGFGHPDVDAQRNLEALEPMGSDICADPWEHTRFTGADELGAAEDSIMFSLTKNEARACLSDDDLDGLNYMYPTCDDDLVRQSPPLCIKTERNIGFVRFLLLVLLPFIISFVVFIALIAYASRRDKARFLRIQSNLNSLMKDMGKKQSVACFHSRGSSSALKEGSTAPTRILPKGMSFRAFLGPRAPDDAAAADHADGGSGTRRRSWFDRSWLVWGGGLGRLSSRRRSEDSRASTAASNAQAAARATEASRASTSAASADVHSRASCFVGGKTHMDRQLKEIKASKAASAKAKKARMRWHKAGLEAFMDTQLNADESVLEEVSATGPVASAAVSPADAEARGHLKRLWHMFDSVAILSFMQEGHLVHHQDRLAAAAARFLSFPASQYADSVLARVAALPKGIRAPAGLDEQSYREQSITPAAGRHLPPSEKEALKKAHRLRKAWFGRLLVNEPGVLDYLMAAEPEAATRAAVALDHMAAWLVAADMRGATTPLNVQKREYHGLVFAPLLVDKWRGLLAEWIVLHSVAESRGTASEAEASDLSIIRQLLRRMQSQTGADENGEQHEMQQVVGSAVRRGSADAPAPTLLGAPKTAAAGVGRVQV